MYVCAAEYYVYSIYSVCVYSMYSVCVCTYVRMCVNVYVCIYTLHTRVCRAYVHVVCV